MNIAPIALFTYARLAHTRMTIEALLKNPSSADHDLIVFSDAARDPSKELLVQEVRSYLSTISGFRSIAIHYRPHNFGLAKSIIEGVTQVLSTYERIIVLEDDLITSPHFLNYMNDALDRFEHAEEVISVHGYVYPILQALPEAFFLRGADCWGWATWRRGWQLFNPNGQELLDKLERENLISTFNFNHTYNYSKMLKDQIAGKNDSWAIRWYASAFLANKLTLYPGRSLIHNIGNDGSGTHCGVGSIHDVNLSSSPIDLSEVEILPSASGWAAFENFFRSSQMSIVDKFRARFKNLLRKMFM